MSGRSISITSRIASDDVQPTLDTLVGELGARVLFGGANFGFRAMQVDGGDLRIELLEPYNIEANDFLKRFLEATGEGPHHLTFKTDDIRRELDQRARGRLPPCRRQHRQPVLAGSVHPSEGSGRHGRPDRAVSDGPDGDRHLAAPRGVPGAGAASMVEGDPSAGARARDPAPGRRRDERDAAVPRAVLRRCCAARARTTAKAGSSSRGRRADASASKPLRDGTRASPVGVEPSGANADAVRRRDDVRRSTPTASESAGSPSEATRPPWCPACRASPACRDTTIAIVNDATMNPSDT